MKEKTMYAIINSDGNVDYVYTYLSSAFDKVNDIGYGHIYKVKIKTIGREIL